MWTIRVINSDDDFASTFEYSSEKKAYNAWNKGDFYSENTILAELCDPDGYEILDMSPM
jgi:hypothetical protein